MKFLKYLILVILLLHSIATSFAASLKYCESAVSERIRLLRSNLEVFKTDAAFDPLDRTKPITKYETYPNGYILYAIDSDEIWINERVPTNVKYTDDHGDEQILRIGMVGNGYEVMHDMDVVARLSTIQVLNREEVKKPEYVPLLEKMITTYKSAMQFHTNMGKIKLPGIEEKVTHYEVNADGLQFEQDFTLKISENLSKDEIKGKYSCRFEDIDRQMHGHYGSDYIYRVDSDDLTIVGSYVSAVM